MQLASIISRLRNQVPQCKKWFVAASLRQMQAGLTDWPSGCLLAPSDTATPNKGITHLSQRVTTRFTVALAIQDLTDMRGESALLAAELLRASVFAALLNWLPDGCDSPVDLLGGRLLYAVDGQVIWGDEFQTAVHLRVLP
jgi:hypothetical protein